MAAKEFAAFVQRNNCRMVVILVHAVLEWILISLLLLDSVVSYLSYRFASYFRLKSPCLFCSRLEHHLHPDKGRSSYRELLCDDHAAEVSLLAYCSVHRKLAEATTMCDECSPSRSSPVPHDVRHPATATLSLLKSEREGKDLDCSCCHVRLESGLYLMSMDLLLKPCRVDAQTGDSIQEKGMLEDGIDHGLRGNQIELGNHLPPPPVCRINAEAKGDEVIRMDPCLDFITTFGHDEVAPAEIKHRAASPVTLAGKSYGDLSKQHTHVKEEYSTKFEDAYPKLKSMVAVFVEKQQLEMQGNYEVTLGSEICATEQIDRPQFPQLTAPVDVPTEKCDKTENAGEIDENDGEDAGESSTETGKCDQENVDDHENQDFISLPALEAIGIIDHPDACKVSVISEICHKKQIGDHNLLLFGDTDNESEFKIQASVHDRKTDLDTYCQATARNEMCNEGQIDQYHPQEPLTTALTHLGEINVFLTEPLIAMDHGLNNHQLSTSPQHNETEEERAPETPNSLENLHSFCKTYLFCRKESGTESMDGESIASELDISEVSTVDQLKSALKDERRALNALFADLEEERSASAIAANQSMAMITRLQQEKAAMQMEALQYQRMMEERSEYDQEALHLLNDQVMKKEKEKQQLEKELEIYRNKVYLYKAKEMRMNNSNTDGRSCTSPALSSGGDGDDLSVDDPNEGEEHSYDPSESNNITARVIAISGAHNEHSKNLNAFDESLAYLEEKRINILEEIKVLEEKLFPMDDGEYSNAEELLETHNLPEENGHGHDCNNEFQSVKLNANHGSKMNSFCIGKRLLPLFDATLSENEENLEDHSLTDVSRDSVSKLTPERKNHAMEEEIDHIF